MSSTTDSTRKIVLPSSLVGLTFYSETTDDEITRADFTHLTLSRHTKRRDTVYSKGKTKTAVVCKAVLALDPMHYRVLTIDCGSSSMGVRCETLYDGHMKELHKYEAMSFPRDASMIAYVTSGMEKMLAELSPEIVVVENQLKKKNGEATAVSFCVASCASRAGIPCVMVDPSVMRSTFGLKPNASKDELALLGVKLLVEDDDEGSLDILSQTKAKKSASGTTVSADKQRSDMLDTLVLSRCFHALMVQTLQENYKK